MCNITIMPSKTSAKSASKKTSSKKESVKPAPEPVVEKKVTANPLVEENVVVAAEHVAHQALVDEVVFRYQDACGWGITFGIMRRRPITTRKLCSRPPPFSFAQMVLDLVFGWSWQCEPNREGASHTKARFHAQLATH